MKRLILILVLVSAVSMVCFGVGIALAQPMPEAATSMTMVSPAEVPLGNLLPVTMTVAPQSGPLPILYTLSGFGQSISEEGGYNYRSSLVASLTGRQTIGGTATQGTTTFTRTNSVNVIAPTGLVISAPDTAAINEVITLTATFSGWTGNYPVLYTWQIPGQDDLITYRNTVTASWSDFGSKDVAVRACILSYCWLGQKTINVPPPEITISWQNAAVVGEQYQTTLMLVTSRIPLTNEVVMVTLNGDPEWTHPFRITQLETPFDVFYDNQTFSCGRTLSYQIVSASGARVVDPAVVEVSSPGEGGQAYRCVQFLPVVVVNFPPPTPTPTPTDTPTPTITPTPTRTPRH